MNRILRHRRKEEGGYARGEETRVRILRSAIPVFGGLGYDGASTRDIAQAAGVNPPALQYYFGSKEGLYRACVEFMAEHACAAMSESLADAEAALARDAPRDQLVDCYIHVQLSLAEFLLANPEVTAWRAFMAREQAGLGPGIAFREMKERFIGRYQGVLARILARLWVCAPDDPELLIRMAAINGQVLIFHVGRQGLLEALGWSDIGPDRLALIREAVASNTRKILMEPHLCAARQPVAETA